MLYQYKHNPDPKVYLDVDRRLCSPVLWPSLVTGLGMGPFGGRGPISGLAKDPFPDPCEGYTAFFIGNHILRKM